MQLFIFWKQKSCKKKRNRLKIFQQNSMYFLATLWKGRFSTHQHQHHLLANFCLIYSGQGQMYEVFSWRIRIHLDLYKIPICINQLNTMTRAFKLALEHPLLAIKWRNIHYTRWPSTPLLSVGILTLPRYLQSRRSLRRSVRFLWMILWRRLCLQNWNRKDVSWLQDSSTPRYRLSRM